MYQMRLDFYKNLGLRHRLNLIIFIIIFLFPISLFGNNKNSFIKEIIPSDDFDIQIYYPSDFKKEKKFGGIISFVGKPEDDGSIPFISVRTFKVPRRRNINEIVKLFEDRYNRLSGYSREIRRLNRNFLIVNRNYHFSKSEMAIEEISGYRKNRNYLMEVRCVVSAMNYLKYNEKFLKIINNIKFLRKRKMERKSIKNKAIIDKINLSMNFIRNGDNQKAKKIIEPLLEKNRNNIELNLLMGKICLTGNDYKNSLKYFKKIVEQNPASLLWNNYLIDVLLHLKKYNQALSYIKKSAYLDGTKNEKAIFYLNKGNYFFRKRMYEKSIDTFEKGLKFNPSESKIHYNMALLLEKLGRRVEALIHYKKAVDSNSSFIQARERLGNILYTNGEYTSAMYQFLYISRLDNKNSDALKKLYLIYKKLSYVKKANKILNRLKKIVPNIKEENIR